MQRCAFQRHRFLANGSRRSAFTLLEMCTVLLVLIILLGALMPAMQSAFLEQTVRGDAHELSLMVKTAMLQSGDQHRPYAIELTSTNLFLHPVGKVVDADETPATNVSKNPFDEPANAEDVETTWTLHEASRLQVPDPQKPAAWINLSDDTWLFEPGALCPAKRVRITHGNGWLEMSFNALTGNVEDESTYLP